MKTYLLLLLVLAVSLTSCYRMPGDDEYSLVPTTNNPDVTRDSGNQMIPGGGF